MSDDYQDLLEWLQQDTRAFGWGGLLAWDRGKVNNLLLQQYIAGFDSGHYLPTFTDLIFTSTLAAEYIYDYTLDCPRLSFENARIQDPRARLRMQVVGGLQLSLEHVSGDLSRVHQIAQVDVLDGRSLYMNLALMQAPGSTGSAGRVVLDLSKGGDFELTFARSEQERWLGGDYFRKQFELLDDSQKILVLGELGSPYGQLLKPADFYITTHAKPGEPDKGAVIMLIRMDGDSHGHTPATDADLRYLLEGGYSFALLLGRDFLMRTLFIPACRRFIGIGWPFVAATEEQPEGITHYLRAAEGVLQFWQYRQETAFFVEVSIWRVELPLKSAECSFELRFQGTDIQLRWSGVHHIGVALHARNGGQTSVYGRVQFEFKRDFSISLARREGRVAFLPKSVETPNACHFSLVDEGSIPGAKEKFRAEVSALLEQTIIEKVDEAVARFHGALDDIALDQMTGLLFHRQEDLVFEHLDFARDLVMFGSIAPLSMIFSVLPKEALIEPGKTHLFTTSPPRKVTWSVDNLPGQSGPVGSINALGFYTAPTAAEVPEALRVKVVATLDGYSSSALVTVMPGDAQVAPPLMAPAGVSVRPLELVMGPGETQLFSTWPPRLVRWRVDNLPGQSSPVGSINTLGLYTAPTAEQLPGPFLRVKVTASLDGHDSSALVTVLPSDITVNPLVLVHTAGRTDGREMSAGTRGGGQLSWALGEGHSGGRIVPSSEADGDHTYFPGPARPELVYSIDEVRVTNLATSRVQTAYVLLLHQELIVVVTAQRGSGDTVQLRAFLEGDEQLEMEREWQVLLGGGSVDRQSGVFTPDASAQRFAIVTVQLHTGYGFSLDGYILLPLPYIELPLWKPNPDQLAALRGPAPGKA